MDPDEIARAARYRADAKALRLKADALNAEAELLERTADTIELLHGDPNTGTNRVMPSTEKGSGRRGPPLKSKGPVARVARKLGISLRELLVQLAAELGVGVETIKTWDRRSSVPDAHREALDRALHKALTARNARQ